MRKNLSITIVLLLAIVQGAMAQDDKPYFTASELPDAVAWLPEPPDTVSACFNHDIMQYMWGKSIRDTERGAQAVEHYVKKVADMARYFSVPFGMTISQEATPAIYKLLARAIPTFRLSVTKPKNTYLRKRPFTRFQEPTTIPWEEEEERYKGSYPSGHTIRGFGMALVLCEVAPDRQDALLKLGYEWGQSRVITGYHWQSDVDASRLMAAGVFARLHTSADFMADMAAAQKEYQTLLTKKQ